MSATTSLPRPVIKTSTMTSTVQDFTIATAQSSVTQHVTDQEIAASIRCALQNKYPASTWHCFVGRDFGCFVSHREECYVYFYIGQLGVCIFAT